MTRNLSLIPTIEAEPEAAPPAMPSRAAPVHAPSHEDARPITILPERLPRAPTPAALPHLSARAIAIEAVKYAGILLLFAAVAWPLYRWIGERRPAEPAGSLHDARTESR